MHRKIRKWRTVNLAVKNKMAKAELIVWLRNSIRSETTKAEDEIDMDFVDNCMELLSVLLDDKYNFTEEQLEEKLVQIKATKKVETVNKVSRKAAMKFRRAIAVCAAVMFLCAGVTVCAFNPTIRDIILSVIDLPIGSSMEHVGITYTYHGKEIVYPDVKTLMENENLGVICPVGSSNDTQIEKIICTEDKTKIWIGYVDEDIYATISKNDDLNLADLIHDGTETYNVNDITSYIVEKEGKFLSATLLDGWVYYVNSDNKLQIIDILNSLKY